MNDNQTSATLGKMTIATVAPERRATASETARGERRLPLWMSTTVLSAALLLLANFGFTCVDSTLLVPMSQMSPAEAAERSVRYKMHALEATPDAPDILLVGSSLPMTAMVYADTLHYKPQMDTFLEESKIEHLNAFQAYPKAVHFEKLLKKNTGSDVRVFNLTVPACMTSDAYFLMNEAIERKKPKTVIWGIAPRDFVDNVIPPIGKTPAFAALPDWTWLGNVVPFQKNYTAAADSVSAAFVRFYNDREVLKHAMFSWLAEALHHPQSLRDAQLALTPPPPAAAVATRAVAVASKEPTAAPKVKPVDKREPGYSEALIPQYKDYDHRYNPPNYRILDAQTTQFERALATCRAKGIRVVLVDMPLPRRHQKLIDPKLHAAYEQRVTSLATKYGATYLDLNHPDNYNADDWIDSLHVTASGADKFLNELVPRLPR